jgi:hypothetical protein
MRKALLAAVLAASLVPACSGPPGPDGPQKVVFQVAGGLQTGGYAAVGEILDLGLLNLQNLTGSTVRLRSVQLVSPPAGLRVLNATAYRWLQPGGYTISASGDLPRACPKEYTPYPLAAAVTRPHANSPWEVIVAMTFSRPGTYHIYRFRINYVIDGRRGWQYQNLDTVITAIRDPAGTHRLPDGELARGPTPPGEGC